MADAFEFAASNRIIFGAGTSQRLGALIAELGHRALVVTGRNQLAAAGLLTDLSARGVDAITVSVAGEPQIEFVEKSTSQAGGQIDVVVAIGGGSVLDAGKAIAALLTNRGPLLNYLEVIGRGLPLLHPSAAFIAVPTTSGTGSEVTRNAVLKSAEHRVKVSLRSRWMLPHIALVDPELTNSLPPPLTASTGLDALTQLIEPYVCTRANPMTDVVCRDGIRRVARSLRIAFRHGANSEARHDMSLASLYGGLALSNAGLGAVHGLAGPFGGMADAPHGAVCAALLPHVMRSNIRSLRAHRPESAAITRYDEVGAILTGNSGADADDAVEWITKLVKELAIPGLGTYGLARSDFDELIEKSLQASSMKANPIELSRADLMQVIESAF
jgi:alcohol dehydrogenase class IV